MPLYSYECNKCGSKMLIRHSMFDKVEKCDACGSGEVERVYDYVANINSDKDIKDKGKEVKVGSKVTEYIENLREDIKEYKQGLKKKDYE